MSEFISSLEHKVMMYEMLLAIEMFEDWMQASGLP